MQWLKDVAAAGKKFKEEPKRWVKLILNLSAKTYLHTVWKVSKYGVISGPYLPVFGLNTGKYRPEITLYLDNFHAVAITAKDVG